MDSPEAPRGQLEAQAADRRPGWPRSEKVERRVGTGIEAGWGAPLDNRPGVLLPGGPWELGQNYLGLAGAEVPYANGSLLGEKEILNGPL